MNIYDISEKAGVSIATVSRVINGSDRVSPATAEKVLAVIEKYGYTPNAFARGLGLNTMQTIGILCADSSDPYLAQAVYFLERKLRQEGYDSLLCCTGYLLADKQKYLTLLLAKRVDSIILVGSNYVESDDSQNDYIRAAGKKIPIMIINASLAGANIYSILCEDFRAVQTAASALIDSGITDILYLYNSLSYSGRKKLSGFRAAYESRQMPLKEDYIQQFEPQDIKVNEVKDFLLALSKKGLKYRAVVTSTDSLAVGALKFAKAAGLRVPEDLSIIGYNNSAIAQCCDPELTSIDNKLELICNQCTSSLMDVLSGKKIPVKSIFSADLIKRGTTSI